MALAAGASLFQAQAVPFSYWYEARPYTWLDTALPAGPEALVSLSQVADVARDPSMAGPVLAVVSDLAVSPQGGVNLVVQTGGTAHPEGPGATAAWPVPQAATWPTTAWPSGLAPTMPGPRDGWLTPAQLQLSWQNTTGAALTTPMQTTATIALTPLTAWQQQLIGLPLPPALAALWQRYQAYLEPWDLRTMLDQVWEGAWIGDGTAAQVVNAGSTPAVLGPFPVTPGTVSVLRDVAVGLPSGSVGNQILLSVFRDSTQPTHSWWADNAAGLATPFRCWITARQRLSLQVTAQTATTGVAVRLRWRVYRLTPVLQALLGLAAPPTAGADAIAYAEAVLGGWIR